ncbi:MAG: hypothetical protein F6K58_18850 [Symploca sp. SIO2E9]|nr:hypothetical protein [Symploca sp. SIO2E9]
MEAATRPEDLEILANLLQEELLSNLPNIAPVEVQCRFLEGNLMVLVQHPADVVLDPQSTFGFLEQAIVAQHSSVSNEVKIYLRVTGQKRPYVYHSLTLATLGEEDATTQVTSSDPQQIELTQSNEKSTLPPASTHPWDQFPPEVELQADHLPPTAPIPASATSKPTMLPLIVASVGLSIVIFSSSLYLLTRPCVIGSCTVISEAQQLLQKSSNSLENIQSGQEVLKAQQQMNSAIRMLESVPPWSKERSNARELLANYRRQAQILDEIVKAMKTASRAAAQSQNPPHPASKWIEIQKLWRKAIALLEQIPADSQLPSLAQRKLKEYNTNLATINQRLLKERQSLEHIKAATEAAKIAEARQGVAQSLEHWQLVLVTWQTAFKRLNQIPQGTTAYEEAQQLSAIYTPKMALARDRKTQEQIAANAYNQGTSLAKRAQNSQKNQQWSAAVINWRNALSYVNQVPNNTFYYAKAQSLIDSYQESLEQAQAKLEVVVRTQQAREDLNRICFGGTPVCSYSINDNVIKVKLTRSYMQTVKQTALTAQVSGDSKAQAGVINHVLRLEDAFEVVSSNAQMRLEVYTPDDALIEVHRQEN